MLVSHRYKFIYLKPRKVGSSTTESYLERYCLSPEEEIHYIPNHSTNYQNNEYGIITSRMTGKRGSKWVNHTTFSKIKKDLPKDIWSKYTIITNVRNPYDMVVSWFHHQTNTNGVNRKLFSRFLMSKHNLFTLYNNKDIWSDEGNYKFNYIRFENLDKDIDNIITKLNLPKYDTEIPHFKKSNRGYYQDYYDNETKDIVYKLFEKEINHFNYKF